MFDFLTQDPLTKILLVMIGLVGGFFLRKVLAMAVQRDAERKREEILDQAKREAEQVKKEMEVEGRQETIKLREDFEKEVQEARRELRQTERRLDKREDGIDKKQELVTKKERYLETAEKSLAENRRHLAQQETEIQEAVKAQKDELYRISGLSQEEARRMLMERIEREVEQDCAEMVSKKLAQANAGVEEKAKSILVDSLQRCSAEATNEATVCTIELPNDDIKGRIIGREGRNIRSFEQATGVDVIVDDTPGVVVLSSFDSVRREAARVAMQRLIADGRIHPGRIEEVAEKAKEEVQRLISEAGNEAAREMGLVTIPDPLKKLLGRLKFRTSFGQNALQHSLEVAELAGMMAGELGLNVQLARRCGLLHDIGKGLDHDQEGSHAKIGGEEGRRWGECDEVINSIEAHHEEVEAKTLYAGLIVAADTMSASRPGARRETLERYVKRLERLEGLAKRHEGVQRAFAIQAGREIRVLVDAEKISDKSSAKLARDIANEIEKELQYPGEVQVTVIRECRFSEVAH
jgi:ribonuclease Y